MPNKTSNLLVGIVFLILVIVTAMEQMTGVKEAPQRWMLLLGVLTLLSLLTGLKPVSTVLFYLLLGLLLYVNYYLLIVWTLNTIDTEPKWIELDDERHPVIKTGQIFFALVAPFFLAVMTVVLYHKKIRRKHALEVATAALFLLVTAVLYFRH
jgi:hypothetical protein